MQPCRLLLFGTLLLAGSLACQAQWVTQTMELKAGWNAVFLHIDPSHATLAELVDSDVNNPILEVWMWAPPASNQQFIDAPQAPDADGDLWVAWRREAQPQSILQRLVGNAAYLIRVGNSVSTYSWTLKGKPLAPDYQWTTTGLNLLGFPTVTPTAPKFDAFLAKSPELEQNAEIIQYVGGELDATNPARIFAYRTTPVNRGQAYWIRSGTHYNRYFGPFDLSLTGDAGLDFGDSGSVRKFRIRNLTSASLTVTVQLAASQAPPAGQPAISGVPPLLLRGALTTNLTYTYTNLPANTPRTWNLTAKGQIGSEVEVFLGLNRYALSGNPGDLHAGVLSFTDSHGLTRVDVGVAATVASSAGLWIGGAALTQVGQYLKTFQRDAQNNLVTDTNGNYIVSAIDTNLNAVPQPFPIRLILHNPTNGQARLLQQVFVGVDANTNTIVSTRESALNRAFLSDARRISTVHLPWTATNTAYAFDGLLTQGATITASVITPYNDQAANPFLHTYHPDHDNLNATFQSTLPQGSESYALQRDIALTSTAPSDDFDSLVRGGQTFSGTYIETVILKGLARAGGTHDTRTFQVRGAFSLNRILETPTLTTP